MVGVDFWMWRARTYVQLMRPKFLLASLLVFVIGTLAADPHPDWSSLIMLAGLASVMLTQLSAGLVNEYADWRGDRFSRRTFFAGGSGVISSGRASPGAALGLAIVSGALALWSAFYIYTESDRTQFIYLIAIGIALSWAYSLRPVRLVNTGLGEIVAAVLIGILLPLTGSYLASGSMYVHWQYSLPLFLFALAMVIAVSYPDRQADIRSSKRNLVYRLGIRRAAAFQALVSFTGYASVVVFILTGELGLWTLITFIMLPFVWAGATVMALSKNYDHYQAAVASATMTFALVLMMASMLIDLVL
jgi:1,4-dihydroxy-2-naphthoate octaprenyltransferase